MKFEFTEEEINELFAMLGKIPYAQVAVVIGWLHNKVSPKPEKKETEKKKPEKK